MKRTDDGHSAARGSGLYDDVYYERLVKGTLASARAFSRFLHVYYQPRSVVDVGCGRGAWLTAFIELGAGRAVGLDGPWNRQEQMLHEAIRLHQVDLRSPFELHERFDLAISLEVAEHLGPEAASGFIGSIASLSDVVLFSAAIPGQGGKGHTNEQWPSYWASRFYERGFVAYDLFRDKFWGDRELDAWYRQNTFLYLKRDHLLMERLGSQGIQPVRNIQFMDCVHPEIYEIALNARAGLRFHLSDTVPSLVRAICRRLPGI